MPPVWSLTLTTAQLAMFDVLQAKVCRRLLRSAKVECDRYESKDSLNSMCNLESLHFRRTLIAIYTILFKHIHFQPHVLSIFDINISRSERRPNKPVFNSYGKFSSSLFLKSANYGIAFHPRLPL